MLSLRFLLKQGIAIRGHKDNNGNLVQLLHLRSSDCPNLSKWLKNQHYMSHDIINKLITLLGNALLQQILIKIHAASWFAILADETTDVANHEQLSMSIRWVNEFYEINEDFIGLVQVPSTTSSTITTVIKDVLIRCALPITQCRGQGYNGAVNMMGHLNGVARRIKDEESTAINVHCSAHSLNLCLQDAAKQCSPVRNTLDMVMEIIKLIKNSPKRSLIFEKCKQDLSHPGPSLKPLCPTRWTVRTKAIDAVLRNYAALMETLDTISSECHGDYGQRANGICSMLERFDTFFGLKLSHLVCIATEQTSQTLQTKDTTVQEVLVAANIAKSYLKKQREDGAFEVFYSRIVAESQMLTCSEPVLPRFRKAPKHLDDGAQPHHFATPKEHFRAQYFEVLDLVGNEITRRFAQASLALPKSIEEELLTAVDHPDSTNILVPEPIAKAYSRDLNIKKLERQLQMLPELLGAYRYQTAKDISHLWVTTVRTICEMLTTVPMAREIYSEVDKLVRIYMTIPVMTATAERSFSAPSSYQNISSLNDDGSKT